MSREPLGQSILTWADLKARTSSKPGTIFSRRRVTSSNGGKTCRCFFNRESNRLGTRFLGTGLSGVRGTSIGVGWTVLCSSCGIPGSRQSSIRYITRHFRTGSSGFLNTDFVSLYSRFIDELSNRYDWVRQYTVINEPLATSHILLVYGNVVSASSVRAGFCGDDSASGTLHVSLYRALKRKGKEIVHVDTAEHHFATDNGSSEWVEFANERRFLILDLVLGRVTLTIRLYEYLRTNGASDQELRWFQDHPETIDLLGLDYYLHSEMEWFWSTEKMANDIHPFNENPRGFASVAGDYVRRYGKPVLLSETNIRGTVEERITWLKFMEEQCEELVAEGTDFRGFCWYPSIDSTDWSNCCTRYTCEVDPQGIWWLDPARVIRHESELSRVYAGLAQGQLHRKTFLPISSRVT